MSLTDLRQSAPPLSDLAPDQENDEQVIHLADILHQSTRKPDKTPIELIKMGAEEDLEATPISLEQEETANALGLDLDEEAVLNRKILAAVERVIQDKYADTIEQRISNAVEEAVTREIAAIKRTLMEDDDSMI